MPELRATPTPGAYMTTVQLLRVPLRVDDENQLYFSSVSAQNTYMQSAVYKSYTNFSYMREKSAVSVPDDYDTLVTSCNYLRYQNSGFGNKWFYAYITEFEYKNPNTTWIHFQIDAYQTYMFNITWKDCFIEREHVKNDSMGAHYIREPVTFAKDVVNERDIDLPYLSEDTGSFQIIPVILLSECPPLVEEAPESYINTAIINGVPQNIYYWVPRNASNLGLAYYPTQYMADINALRAYLIDNQKIDTITAAFMVPRFALSGAAITDVAGLGGEYAGAIIQNADLVFNKSAPRQTISTRVQQYDYPIFTPKNNKVYTSQYYDIIIANNQGETMELKPEYLIYHASDTPADRGWNLNYYLTAPISADAAATLCLSTGIQNGEYGTGTNYYKLSISDFPVPAITGDYFSAWLSGHMASTGMAAASGLTTTLIGATMAAGPAGTAASIGATMVVSGLMSVGSAFASAYDASTVADPVKIQSKNTGRISSGYAKFNCYIRSISWDNAEKLDNYFTMYGYKVNELKVPEFATRQYYNYYKMPVCNITGNIPQSALDEIRSKFERGITLWNTSDVGNYRDGDNPIVTT